MPESFAAPEPERRESGSSADIFTTVQPKTPRAQAPPGLGGEFWGGLAAMLIALPSAIAFGVTVYSPLGANYAATGAIAGIVGTVVVGIVASVFGGTKRLITTPSAPVAALMAAFVASEIDKGLSAPNVLLAMLMVALMCGIVQVIFGLMGLGRLIKYMPFPVVSGFSAAVGVMIVVGQIPVFVGAPKHSRLIESLSPSGWSGTAILVGSATAVVMLLGPKITKAVPSVILGLTAGIGVYFGIAFFDRSFLTLDHNGLVLGVLAGSRSDLLRSIVGQWKSIGEFNPHQIRGLLTPALSLAALLSVDTLKTSVVLDALTHSRHEPNRELVGQGLANIASTCLGGMSGSGQTGATLVNVASGGKTRLSGVIEGALALVVFLLFSKLIAWLPLAALAAILIVVGIRMIDAHSFDLLKSRSTALDFLVFITVIIVAVTVGLVAATAAGVGLAIMLFVRQQLVGSVVHRKVYGNQRFSKQMRLPEEMEVLERYGSQCVIFELQGSLFFGTADQLYSEVEPELNHCTYVVLDMRRVQSVDLSAAHTLIQFEDVLADRGSILIFSHMPNDTPTGQDMQQYFDRAGILRRERHALVFDHLDAALEWVENCVLDSHHVQRPSYKPLDVREIDLFRDRKKETIAAFESCMELRRYKVGETIFKHGDSGSELFLIRCGAVRIVMPLSGRSGHHLATFGSGDFFGEISFLDRAPRTADAVVDIETELYVLTRERFDTIAAEHRMLAMNLLEGMATALASRLRRTDQELRSYQEN
jgi:sulfate permease, SulP family